MWKSNIFAGFGGKADAKCLDDTLQLATHSEKPEVPKDILLAITQSSHHEDDRRTIMRHIALCLHDTAASKWRRISTGLTVVEHLLRNGSPLIVSETTEGMHFDIAQRLSFLENFEYSIDKRVEALIRRKVTSVRGAWVEVQKKQQVQASKEKLPKRPVVFHAEDTDDDLSDAEAESKAVPMGRRNLQEESTTDEDFSPRLAGDLLFITQTPRSEVSWTSNEAANVMDLLGVEDASEAAKPGAIGLDLL